MAIAKERYLVDEIKAYDEAKKSVDEYVPLKN